MRLWHKDLIPRLPRQQLLGQHRECCALRGNGWGKRHATVDYVFTHPYAWLYHFHVAVMTEMARRGYKVNILWLDIEYASPTVTRRCLMHHLAPLAERLDGGLAE